MTDFTTLQLSIVPPGVATLWLNRPEKHNAFNAQMIAELNQALGELAARDDVRFVLLRGRGKHFSAGADLNWMQASAGLSYDANLRDAQALGELMERLYRLPQPTLAVVQGAAFAGAMGLVSCCDMAIGAQDALFSLSEVRIGLAPAVISPYVAKAIGERATRRYTLSADRFDGVRARELGLLAECYAPEALEDAVAHWTANLLKNSPRAMREGKALLLNVGAGNLSPALRAQTETCIARLRTSEEGQEGLAAFLEKRTPSWMGAAS